MKSGGKTEFWWASIHGADPEPVEKTEHEGRPCVYTLGCADPFYLDEPGVQLIGTEAAWSSRRPTFVENLDQPVTLMERPNHPDKEAAEQAALAKDHELSNAAWRAGRKTYVNTAGRRVEAVHHSWRGPR